MAFYVPGAALPPSVEWAYGSASSFYPYRAQPSYNGKNRLTGTACGGPNFLRFGQGTCQPLGSGAACGTSYPQFWGANGYYQPYGVPLGDLPFGAGATDCSPSRGCLDPLAYTYDKMADVHCQEMCLYRKPKVCVAEPPAQFADPDAAAACVDEATGRTAIQDLYAAKQGSKERRVGRGIFESDM